MRTWRQMRMKFMGFSDVLSAGSSVPGIPLLAGDLAGT
jgi:hypothetical protein